MSYSRKVSRGIANKRSNLLKEPQNAVKQVMARKKRTQVRLWTGQIVVDGLLKCCGHGVRVLKTLDQYHENIYVRGTTISATGRTPRVVGLSVPQQDDLRRRIKKAIKEHEAGQVST